jgi:hypothetical protein
MNPELKKTKHKKTKHKKTKHKKTKHKKTVKDDNLTHVDTCNSGTVEAP